MLMRAIRTRDDWRRCPWLSYPARAVWRTCEMQGPHELAGRLTLLIRTQRDRDHVEFRFQTTSGGKAAH